MKVWASGWRRWHVRERSPLGWLWRVSFVMSGVGFIWMVLASMIIVGRLYGL